MSEQLSKAEKLARAMHNIISGGQAFNKQIAAQVRDELRRLDEEGSWKSTHEYCAKLWDEERALCLEKIADLRARLAAAEEREKAAEGLANWCDVLLEAVQATSCDPDDPEAFDEAMMGARQFLDAYRKSKDPRP